MTGRTAAFLTAGVIGPVGAFLAGDGLFGTVLIWLLLGVVWMTVARLVVAREPDEPPPFRGIPPPQHDAQWWRDAGCPDTADLIERGHHKEDERP